MIQKIEFQFLSYTQKNREIKFISCHKSLIVKYSAKFKIQQESFALAPNYFDDIALEM